MGLGFFAPEISKEKDSAAERYWCGDARKF